jgi:hypothetical protein
MTNEGRIQAIIDPSVAKAFRHHVIDREGSSKKTSEVLERYIKEGLAKDGVNI